MIVSQQSNYSLKKTICLLLSLSILLSLFISCTKFKPHDKKLVGKWRQDSTYGYSSAYFDIKSNGEVSLNTTPDSSTVDGFWYTENGKLYINYLWHNAEFTKSYEYRFEGDTLVLNNNGTDLFYVKSSY